MKLQSLAVFAAVAVATVSAAECTEKQLAAYADVDQTPFEKACPSLFLDGEGDADPTDISTFTNESLKALEPCKAKTCLAEGKKLSDATPDCTVNGFNIKDATTATLKLCEAFAAGPVSVETAKSMFKDISESLNDAFGSLMDDDGSEEDSSAPTVGSDSNDKPANATGADATKPSAAPTTAPTPAPTTKSDASSLSVAAGAVVSALAMSFVL